MKIQASEYEFKKVEPLNGDCRKPEYLKMFPTGLSPAINDNGFLLAEGSAILQYLCEKNNWDDWYPIGNDIESIKKRAKVNEYLSSHHSTTRSVSAILFRPFLLKVFKMGNWEDEDKKKAIDKTIKIVQSFEQIWLSNSKFIVGDKPTIADLMAYNEIAQLSQIGLLNYEVDGNFTTLNTWMKEMRSLPFHDDVHKTLMKLAVIAKKQL